MASNVTENKITHITTDLVFRGKDYSSWRSRMYSLLQCEDYDDLLYEHPEEDYYAQHIDDDPRHPPADRSTEQRAADRTYAKRQAKAKNIVYNHMDTPYYRLIRYCATVRDIFERLDDDYFTRTDSGIIQLRREMTSITYDGKTPMETFIADYEHRCEAYIDAGGSLTTMDWVHQLHGALPAEFDSAIDWFSSLSTYKQSYHNYRNRIIEQAKRLKRSSLIPSFVQSTSPSQPSRPNTSSNNANTSTSNTTPSGSQPSNDRPNKRCPYCRYRGHSARECFRLQRRLESMSTDENKPCTEGKPPTEGKPKDEKPTPNTEQKDDWSHFKNLSLKREDPKDKDPKRSLGLVAHVTTVCPTIDRSTQHDEQFHVFPAVSNSVSTAITPPIDLQKYNGIMLLDSGTTFHLTNELSDLTDVRDTTATYHIHGIDSDKPLIATKMGNMRISLENYGNTEHDTVLHNVLFVPNLSTKLLSVIRITENDLFSVLFRASITQIFDNDTGAIVISATRSPKDLAWIRFCYTDKNRTSAPALPAVPKVTVQDPNRLIVHDTPIDSLLLWHRRLGHISAKYLQWAINTTVGLPNLKIIDSAFRDCSTCLQAKSTQLPHSNTRSKPSRRFELLCSDVCDAKCVSVTGHKQFVTFIDAFSGYTELVPIKSKADVPHEFAKFHKWITNRFPTDPVATLRCDNAKEYVAGDMRRYCEAAGIHIDSGCPFTPQLNGLAERKNRTLIEKIRVLLLDAGLSVEYWPFAAKTAIHILNRIPCKTNANNCTPYELIYDTKPNIQNFRVFGSLVLRHLPQAVRTRSATQRRLVDLSKLGPVAVFAVMFGYTDTGYEMLEYDTNRIVTSRDARFIESENILTFQQNTQTNLDDTSSSNAVPERDAIQSAEGDPGSNILVSQPENVIHISPELSHHPHFSDDIVPSIAHSELDPVTATNAMLATVRSKWNRPCIQLSDCVPKNFNDAVTSKFASQWIEAMEKEFDSHADNKTWHVVPRSEASNLIRTLWVYTTKVDNDGNEFAKARLVAFGCADSTTYENKDTYAAVCPIEIIRLMLSFAVTFNFTITSMDVTTAFLYGKIDTNVYISIPQGLTLNRSQYALKLDKALYGLKISSKLWHDTLRSALGNIGYVNSLGERCLYLLKQERSIAFLITYVDDLLLLSNSSDLTEYTLHALTDEFRMRINRSPTHFIGLQFSRMADGRHLTISQTDYIQQLARKFNIVETRPYYTPLEMGFNLRRKDTILNDDREYRAYVGALLYLARFSRPDISFAVHVLSTLQGHVDEEARSAARRVLKYVIGTSKLSLNYTNFGDTLPWRAFIDASHATEASSKSVSGFLFFNYGNVVDWSTRKQPIVALSSTAAEIIAVASYLDHMLIPRALLSEIFSIDSIIEIYEDNTSTIHAFEGGSNRQLRWTLIKAHAVSEAVQAGYLHFNYIPTAEQLADCFTKIVDRTKFEKARHYFLRE